MLTLFFLSSSMDNAKKSHANDRFSEAKMCIHIRMFDWRLLLQSAIPTIIQTWAYRCGLCTGVTQIEDKGCDKSKLIKSVFFFSSLRMWNYSWWLQKKTSPNILTCLSEGQNRELIFKRMLSCSFNWNTSTVYVSTPVSQQADEQLEVPTSDHLSLMWVLEAGLYPKTLLKFTWKKYYLSLTPHNGLISWFPYNIF